MNVIEIKDLRKCYGDIVAVDSISFNVKQGSLFAFLGTNGAGKSTTINVLSTLIKADTGSVIMDGHVLDKEDIAIRKAIGVVFQNGVLDELLSVEENLLVRASFYGIANKELKKRIEEVSVITDCREFLNRKYKQLSGGQKRKADIARALIHKPKILFLDEPTTGLDPKTRKAIWQTIANMQKELGMTVFLTTHYMEEAANADNIVVINKGKIVAEGTPYELKSRYAHDRLIIHNPVDAILEECKKNNMTFQLNKDKLEIITNEAVETIDFLCRMKLEILSFEMVQGSMDDVFLSLTDGVGSFAEDK